MKKTTQTCDFCSQEAIYDGKTKLGPWAFMCQRHFGLIGTSLYTVLKKEAIQTKCCSLCDKEKDINEFYPYVDARGVSRTRNECKECNLAARKEASMRRARRERNG